MSWGIDLASEHERFLTEEIFKKPTIVYNYPKDIKAFYMRLNDDGKTVAAMDVLVPGVGELIGGSQREERLEVGRRVSCVAWYARLVQSRRRTDSRGSTCVERMQDRLHWSCASLIWAVEKQTCGERWPCFVTHALRGRLCSQMVFCRWT